jgi:hypothetical protein
MRQSLRPFAILLLATACGGGGGDPAGPDPDPGPAAGESTFSATFTGYTARSITGTAKFSVETSATAMPGFNLMLGVTDRGTRSPTRILFRRAQAVRPVVGAYPIADPMRFVPETEIIAIILIDGDRVGTCQVQAQSGTLTITESSSTRLKGTYSASGVCSGDRTVRVSGSFDAGSIPTIPITD